MTATATRKVKFYVELVTDVVADHRFEVGDEIIFEDESLIVRSVEAPGVWSGHPDAMRADLVVKLTQYGRTFMELREVLARKAGAA